MATYALSDIHGCFDEFMKVWRQIKFDKNCDKLIILGDMIDRGKDSYKVVRFIRNLQKRFGKSKIIVLCGNHEQLFIDYLENSERSNYYAKAIYFQNGGNATLESYKAASVAIDKDLNWMKKLPLYYEAEYFIAVHAGLRGGVKLENQSREDMLWIREEFHDLEDGTFDKSILFGHSICQYHFNTDTIAFVNGNVCIDTGCVAGNKLSCIKMVKDEIIQIITS